MLYVDDSLVLNGVLCQCIPKLPNLQRLNVYRGEALEGTGNLIQLHCPLFKALQFYGWYDHITKLVNCHPNRSLGRRMMQIDILLRFLMPYGPNL